MERYLMLSFSKRSFKTQMLVIVCVVLVVPIMMLVYNIIFASRTDDFLVGDMEKELMGIVKEMNSKIQKDLTLKQSRESQQHLEILLEDSFRTAAGPLLVGKDDEIRLCMYDVESHSIFIEGYLHDYRPPGGEGYLLRKDRILKETREGINAVLSTGKAITTLGKTWDDQFLEYLEPLYVDNKLRAIIWAEKRMHPVFAREANARQTILVITLLIFLAGVGSTVLATNRMTSRVIQIKEGLVALEKNLNSSLPDMPGELGQISKAINNMAAGLLEKEKLTEQLRSSERLASLGRIVADIAHELRNPVSIVQATVELMEPKVNESQELTDCLDMIKVQMDRQKKLISDLLSFSGTNRVSMEPIIVNEFLQSVTASTLPVLIQSKIDLLINYPEKELSIIGDRDKLTQVFINIIINAVQAMPEGGRLSVDVFPKEDMICLAFKDTGVGIPEEQLDQIFEPYYSVKAGGSGLGLAISRRIIEIHKGFVKVDSKPGQGTNFMVFFPIS
jgi:signal transduction histidine kinase